jgi:hypothetical protein
MTLNAIIDIEGRGHLILGWDSGRAGDRTIDVQLDPELAELADWLTSVYDEAWHRRHRLRGVSLFGDLEPGFDDAMNWMTAYADIWPTIIDIDPVPEAAGPPWCN